MICTHRTTRPGAFKIMSEGFRDCAQFEWQEEHTGVWLSDCFVDETCEFPGDTTLVIEIPEGELEPFEWIEKEMPYRKFLVPAAVVNRYGPPRISSDRMA